MNRRRPYPTERQCRIAGCQTVHGRHLFACRDHWHALTWELRTALLRAYRLEGIFSESYLQACEDAEAYLEHREPAQIVGDRQARVDYLVRQARKA